MVGRGGAGLGRGSGWLGVDTEDQESDEVLLAVDTLFLGRRTRTCTAQRVRMTCARDSRLDVQQRIISGALDDTK